jgi:hypothetical protein
VFLGNMAPQQNKLLCEVAEGGASLYPEALQKHLNFYPPYFSVANALEQNKHLMISTPYRHMNYI